LEWKETRKRHVNELSRKKRLEIKGKKKFRTDIEKKKKKEKGGIKGVGDSGAHRKRVLHKKIRTGRMISTDSGKFLTNTSLHE